MATLLYYWGFDSSTEGWTGGSWEAGGNGGFDTGHLYASSYLSYGGALTFKRTDISIPPDHYIFFVLRVDGPSDLSAYIYVSGDSVALFEPPVSSGEIVMMGFKSTFNITELNIGGRTNSSGTLTVRLDSVAVMSAPDDLYISPLVLTQQHSGGNYIEINKSISGKASAFWVLNQRPDRYVSSFTTEFKYNDSYYQQYTYKCPLVDITSLNGVDITATASSDLQKYFQSSQIVTILDSNWYPTWVGRIHHYHNHNVTNPDVASLSLKLDGTGSKTDQKELSLKFVAGGYYNLDIPTWFEVTSGSTDGINSLTATVEVLDSNDVLIDSIVCDVLTCDTKTLHVNKSYDNEDLTLRVTVVGDGNVSNPVTITMYQIYSLVPP